VTRLGIANFIHALFLVYYALIFVRVIFSWLGIPSQPTLLLIFRFIYDVTEPYLGLFRRFIPAMGGMDFSPFIGILVLYFIERIIVEMIVSL
jgi:YggT family protein